MLRNRLAPAFFAALLSFALLGASARAAEVTTGVTKHGVPYRASKWTAKKTSFVHITYLNRQGQRNHSVRYAKRVGSGPKGTIRYYVDAPIKTHGTKWHLGNGTWIDHRRLTGRNGEKMTPEHWVIGKRQVVGTGEFIAPGEKMTTKYWKAGRGRGNVLGINHITGPDGTRRVVRFGQKKLPEFRPMPSFIE